MRHIIWDMGGTLVNTYPEVDRCLCETTFGNCDPENLRVVTLATRRSIAHAMDTLVGQYDANRGAPESACEALKERWRHQPAPVMEGTLEVMEWVSRVGGLNLVATHRDHTSTQHLLSVLDLHVNDMVCAPDGIERKPSPTMNLLLAKKHGLDPKKVLCVGDRPIDIAAARDVHMPAVLFVCPGASVTLPDGAPGALVVASLTDLLSLFTPASDRGFSAARPWHAASAHLPGCRLIGCR